MSKKYSCHKIAEGKAKAEAIITHDRIMFYQVRPEDGVMEEKNHELEGRSIAQKVLLFPGGKGSSVVQQDGLYHLDRFHNMPAALIIQDPDPVLVAGAIIMELPMVTRWTPPSMRPSRTATWWRSTPTRAMWRSWTEDRPTLK